MATKFPDFFAALAAPFHPHEVKTRQAPGGRTLHYVTSRTIMNRLDEVAGPENWWDEYQPLENSVMCRLTIRLPDGATLTKCDAGGYAGMADSGDDDKSGWSDAIKRAAAKMGPGRYLYRDGVPNFVAEREPSLANPPDDPSEANRYGGGQRNPTYDGPSQRPQHQDDGRRPDPRQGQQGGEPRQYDDRPPTTGKQMFAWTKSMEQKHEVGLLSYLNGWAKLQDFPGRMVDWDADMVRLAHAEAVRKIQSIEPQGGGNQEGPAYEQAPAGASVAGADQSHADAVDPLSPEGLAIGHMRKTLVDLVNKIARKQTRKKNPENKDIYQAISSVHQCCKPGTPRLSNVTHCDDDDVLAEYLTQAELMLKSLDETEQPSGQRQPALNF